MSAGRWATHSFSHSHVNCFFIWPQDVSSYSKIDAHQVDLGSLPVQTDDGEVDAKWRRDLKSDARACRGGYLNSQCRRRHR
jgi:hypothetical protein